MQPRFARSFALIAFLAVAIAPPAAWAQQQQMPRALQPPEIPGINWTRFADPHENAFTMDVPAGWHVEGGMLRRAPLDVSPFLRALSPDGLVMLILGDPDPTVFHTPGFDRRVDVSAYRGGVDFARDYVQRTVPQLCAGLTEQSERQRPDIASGPLGHAIPGAQYDAGEVVFSCNRSGHPAVAYMVAGTYLIQSGFPRLSHVWGYNLLAGCIAPPELLEESKQIVLHMLLSSRNDPQWVRMQQGIVDQAARNILIITEAQQHAFEGNMATARGQMAAMSQQAHSFDEILTQTGTYQAPNGQRFQMDNTQPYHWFAPGGRTAQTAGPNPPPGLGWQRMQQVAPQ